MVPFTNTGYHKGEIFPLKRNGHVTAIGRTKLGAFNSDIAGRHAHELLGLGEDVLEWK